jgi:hypothetical protein
LLQIDSDGQVVDVGSGELKGDGLGLLWVNDPDTGLISSVSGDGTVGEIVIPTDGTITPTGSGVRSVAGAGGYLWLMDDDHPNGSAVTRFDPRTGELTPLPITAGLVGMAGFEDGLWMTSSTDDLVAKVDPETGEVHRFPVPGKLGGLLVADGSLWVMLHQFGALVRLDTSGDLVESGDVFYEGGVDGHRLLCTGDPASSGPTILLEPYEWVDYGSWSVVQARLAAAGQRVCTHGYLEEEVGPERRADDLRAELAAANIPGPYVLVAAGDGVHAVRLFADGRDDIAGVVLVDPMALNFSAFYDETVPNLTEHPPWGNLATTVALGLGGLGDIPLVVIGHDPDAAYLSPQFVAAAGSERSNLINDFWQEGLRYYAGLTPVSSILEASGSGTMVIWDDPDFVVDSIIDVATP